MRNFKFTLSIASLALVASCDWRDFDELEDTVWVRASPKGNLNSRGFGIGLVPTGSTGQLKYFVAADVPAAAVLITFDQQGGRKASTPTLVNDIVTGAAQLQRPPTLASDPSSFASTTMGNVAIGIFDADNSQANAFMILGSNGVSTGRFILGGGAEPTGLAFGNSDASAAVDLFAVAGAELSIVPDYQAASTSAPADSCGLSAGGGEILIAEVDAANAEAEVLVSAAGEIFVGTGATIQAAAAVPEACFSTVPALGTITAPGGEASFGGLLHQGDFDGNGETDLVIAAPTDNAVYVFRNWTVAAPSAGQKVATPGGAVSFGSSVAVGDFNGDGRDELIVGDPGRNIAAHDSAGKVYIFDTDASGVFQAPIELHDARAEDSQVFGQSLAVVQAFGSETLVVGAKEEVFTYFRTPVSGDDDFRQ